MKRYCFSLSFGQNEEQSISVLILVSKKELTEDEALSDLANALFKKYKEERRTIVYSKYFNSLPGTVKDSIRHNYSLHKEKFEFDVSLDEFALWLREIPRRSFSGVDGFGEILGWEIHEGFVHLLETPGLEFKEFGEAAEGEIVYAISRNLLTFNELQEYERLTRATEVDEDE